MLSLMAKSWLCCATTCGACRRDWEIPTRCARPCLRLRNSLVQTRNFRNVAIGDGAIAGGKNKDHDANPGTGESSNRLALEDPFRMAQWMATHHGLNDKKASLQRAMEERIRNAGRPRSA